MSNNLQPTPLGLAPSFGFGDRIGLATPGHAEAMRRAAGDIQPIFPQQSIREMTRTGRSPRQVMNDALAGMKHAGWAGPTGADADHLKCPEDVDRTAEVGFTFFTIDPSDHVDNLADSYDPTTLRDKFAAVRDEARWYETYFGSKIELPTGAVIDFHDEALQRCAVKYGRAINHALDLAEHIRLVNADHQRDFEIELSVDETDQPTTLAEHFIIAEQCLNRGMKLVSLAPRFIGDMEKGVDYKGDPEALERSLADHAAVADRLGPYKLSLHSGSDKLSMYPALARATKGRFHVKTAGTSYLEALRVPAMIEPALFRRIIDFARDRYETDRATYHVSATLGGVPPQADVDDDLELQRLYLERWDDVAAMRGFVNPGRQVLHCTFGSVLTDPTLGKELRSLLETNLDAYTEVLAEHFAKHLQALNAGR